MAQRALRPHVHQKFSEKQARHSGTFFFRCSDIGSGVGPVAMTGTRGLPLPECRRRPFIPNPILVFTFFGFYHFGFCFFFFLFYFTLWFLPLSSLAFVQLYFLPLSSLAFVHFLQPLFSLRLSGALHQYPLFYHVGRRYSPITSVKNGIGFLDFSLYFSCSFARLRCYLFHSF